MRLIDADKMRKASRGIFIYQDEFEDDVQHIACEAYTKEDIENERTIEAIPIDWIVNWLNKSNRHYCDVDLMLEEWEKENGK